MLFDFESLTEYGNRDLFDVIQQAPLYVESEDTPFVATFEMSLDYQVIKRNRYTLFDWLSGIGGIYGILTLTLGSLFKFVPNAFNDYLISQLYDFQDDQTT